MVKNHYKTTPATSVTVTKRPEEGNRKTVWLTAVFTASIYYGKTVAFAFATFICSTKIYHRFIQPTKPAPTNAVFLPAFCRCYIWSKPGSIAGLRFKAFKDGQEILLQGGDPVITDSIKGKLHIDWPLTSFEGALQMDIDEKFTKIKLVSKNTVQWF